MALPRSVALRWLIRSRWRRPTWHKSPELTREDRNDIVALGRQIITLLTCALFIAGGYLSGHVDAGYGAAWHSFAFGALWISFVDHPFEWRRPRSTPHPFEPPVP